MSAKELGRALHFTSGATTTLVDRLVRRDLLERHAHPTDGRVSLVALTADADRILADGRAWMGAPVLEVAEERQGETVRVLDDLTTILSGLSGRLASTNRAKAGGPTRDAVPPPGATRVDPAGGRGEQRPGGGSLPG